MAQLNAIIKKIQKMRKLRDNPSATPGEIANAAAMVQKLTIEHGIAEAELAIEAGDELRGYGHEELTGGYDTWQRQLMEGLTTGFMCRLVLLDGHKTFDVIGHKDNVAIVIELYKDLTHMFDRMAETVWKIYRDEKADADPELKLPTKKIPKTEFRASFLYGASRAVFDRMLEQLKRNTASKALMVIEDTVDKMVDELHPELGKAQPLDDDRRRGFEAGYIQGLLIDLEGNKPKLRGPLEKIGVGSN